MLHITHRRPPRFFRGRSSGFGNGFGALTGGGSKILVNLVLTSSASSVSFITKKIIETNEYCYTVYCYIHSKIGTGVN